MMASGRSSTSTSISSVDSGVNFGIVNKRYRLTRKFGNGAFGELYLAVDMSNGEEVAAKLEREDMKSPQLKYEANVYRILKNSEGIPGIRYFGKEYGYNILIMDLLGANLESLFDVCGRRFSLKTVLMLGEEMINRLECVHEKNFIHRDVKPENFVMGSGSDCNKLFLIDFGLAKKYRDSRTGVHVPYRDNRSMTGTARYCSINAHSGIEQSRRDDLESLAYVLLYFLRGSLPWQGIQAARAKQKYEKIYEMKFATSLQELCQGLPKTFFQFLEYCRCLCFEEKPNYQLLREEFGQLFKQRGFQRDYLFDWTILKHQNALMSAAQQHNQPPKTPNHPPMMDMNTFPFMWK